MSYQSEYQDAVDCYGEAHCGDVGMAPNAGVKIDQPTLAGFDASKLFEDMKALVRAQARDVGKGLL